MADGDLHFIVDVESNWPKQAAKRACCDGRYYARFMVMSGIGTYDRDDVTCGNCRRTKAFKEKQ